MREPVLKRTVTQKFRAWMFFQYLRWENTPLNFKLVTEGDGEDVYHSMDVYYPSFYDTAAHRIRRQLTTKVLLDGWNFNAFRVVETWSVDGYTNMSVVQPVCIEGYQVI